MDHQAILRRLYQDEVVTLESANQINALYEYMVENDIDPDRFRRDGLDIWIG